MPTLRVVALMLVAALSACGDSGGGDSPDGPFVGLLDFQPAAVVIGHSSFTNGSPNDGGAPNAATLLTPQGRVAVGSLYVADTDNNRVLGFDQVPTADGAPADFVLGQPDFTTTSAGTTDSQFNMPTDTVVAGSQLFLADFGNSRVLIWNALPTADTPADVVVGQSDFTSGTPGQAANRLARPTSVAVASGRLFVADAFNHRVLVWNTIPTANGTPADLVLGETDFTSGVPGASASDLSHPRGVWADADRLVVADLGNSRVLVWNGLPTTNNEPADLVLGQPDFSSNLSSTGAAGMASPNSVSSNGTQLFVADAGNQRVLVFDAFPTANGAAASRVLGQSTFSHVQANDDDQDGVQDATPSARTLHEPHSVFVQGDRVFVTDQGNSRVLIFEGT